VSNDLSFLCIKLNIFTDFKANSFVFINTFYVINIIKFLNVKAQRLFCFINIKGYNKKAKNTITYILQLYFIINKRR
jgi:hypothetical protein